jgi:uncharacterized protein YndB with AHSA1/START domain
LEINAQAPLVARKEIFIQASLDKVWGIQTNINSWKDWQPDIRRAQLDGALTPGSVFRWTTGGFAVTSTLQEVEPKRRVAWTGQAFGSSAKHIWAFRPQGDGTLVTTEESMEGWLILLLKPLMPRFLEKSLDVWLGSLKTKAEGKATGMPTGPVG